MIKTVLYIFGWVIFHYFLQLIFRLTPPILAAKSNQKLVNQKLSNTVLHCTVLILDALYCISMSDFQHFFSPFPKIALLYLFLHFQLLNIFLQKILIRGHFQLQDFGFFWPPTYPKFDICEGIHLLL